MIKIKDIIVVPNFESITALINKKRYLPDTYVPNDLCFVDVDNVCSNDDAKKLRKEAAISLKELFDDALSNGLKLYACSGYRSYERQKQIFEDYCASDGEKEANRYSARPGSSEHQTGLCMDVTCEGVGYELSNSFEDTEEGKFILLHSHEYGFIIRYPKGKENITGYIYEPWHLRYLGKEIAAKVFESGLTYDEYYMENLSHN